MEKIVLLKGNDIFTDSLVISRGTGVAHRKLKESIRKNQNVIERFGKLSTPYQAESTGGRPEEYYLLNEEQATFLITLLKNTEKVVEFKANLVSEFYKMRWFARIVPALDFAEADLLVERVFPALLTLADGLHDLPFAIYSPPFLLKMRYP